MSQTLYNDDLFDSRKYDKNQYSTFIEQLQQSTQKLMNEVFNTQYIPQINEQQIILDKLNKEKNKQSIYSLMTDSRKKKIINDLSNSKKTTVTKCTSERELSQSFVNFLKRNDKWKQRRLQRAKKQINKKQQDQFKNLTFIPTILRGSIQKLQPIYQRGLDIHKNKQKKLALKRIEKQRSQTQKQSQFTFQPEIKTKAKNRTLDEYLKDKQEWLNKKQEYIENSKIIRDAMKYEQCLFQPILVAKYNKNNPNIKKGEKVEDRLLRTLQKQTFKK